MEVGMKIGRPVKWTKVMNVLVDHFAKDAVAHIEHNEKQKLNLKLQYIAVKFGCYRTPELF